MKIKVNLAKDTVSIKGLTPLQFALIDTLLSHVRLGQGHYDGGASDAAFEILNAAQEASLDLDIIGIPEVCFCAEPNENIEGTNVSLDSPTLEMYVV